MACPFVPWPLIGGGRTRSWHLSAGLASHHEVHLLALRSPGEPRMITPEGAAPYASVTVVDIPEINPRRYSPAWAVLRMKTFLYTGAPYYRRSARLALGRAVRSVAPAALVLEFGWMAPYAAVASGIPSVVDQHNYDPLVTARIAARQRGLSRIKWQVYAAAAKASERRGLRQVRGVAAVTASEAALFKAIAPHADVAVVPNGVDTTAFKPSPLGTAVVMTGSMDYAPNAEGAHWLAREVWPLVRRVKPNAELRLVGAHGEMTLASLAGIPGVRVVGTVPDVLPELARARVAVAPIHIGGGTRIKILEAFAAGRPVVATPAGAEGLDVTDGEDIFLRSDPSAFADAIVELLNDRNRADALAVRGRALAVRAYDWKTSAARFEELITRVATT